jgi:hypothetical protein
LRGGEITKIFAGVLGGLWVHVFAFRFLMLFEGILFFFLNFYGVMKSPSRNSATHLKKNSEFCLVFLLLFFFGSLCRSLNSTGVPPR